MSVSSSPGSDEASVGTAGIDARSMWALLLGNALSEVGIGFILPILPLFLARRGGSASLIGLIFAAGVAGRLISQYPAGRLSDRFGRRGVIVGSMFAYSLLFPVYLLPLPPESLIALRFVHALVGGAYVPAAMALVADLAPEGGRGSAFGRMRASDMVGVLLGPALGGLVAGYRIDAIFLGGFAICLLATISLLRLPRSPATARDSEPEVPVPLSTLVRRLLPVAVLALPVYWTFGTYDTVWSLYITSRGATPFMVGLSFASYALPIVLLGGWLGVIGDRLGYVRAAALALVAFGLLAGTYPFISSVTLLILIGVVEGALTAAGNPALQSAVSMVAPPGAQGRMQGLYGVMLALAEIGGAVGGGFLYAFGPRYSFLAVTAICLAGAAIGVVLDRQRRVHAE